VAGVKGNFNPMYIVLVFSHSGELLGKGFINSQSQIRICVLIKNVFNFLRDVKQKSEVIVLDPPSFVKKRLQVGKGSRADMEVNRLAIKALSAGGFLVSCSCSAHISWDLFQKILFSAAQEGGKKVRITGRYEQLCDHPRNIYHLEGEYLKSFLLQVI
jgi:23S rRNA (cytosine1962-C5)-methyltransferase